VPPCLFILVVGLGDGWEERRGAGARAARRRSLRLRRLLRPLPRLGRHPRLPFHEEPRGCPRRAPGHLRLPPPQTARLRAPQPDEDVPLPGRETPGVVAVDARPPPGAPASPPRPRRASSPGGRRRRPPLGLARRPAGGRPDALRRRPRPPGHRRRPRRPSWDRQVPAPFRPRDPQGREVSESMNYTVPFSA